MRNVPLTSDDGTYQGVLGLSEDVSQERSLREALSDERQREEEMLKLAAHELRTPLTSILGFAKRLQRGTGFRGDTDSWREHIDIIVASAERLRRSMDFVIKLANLDRSQLSLERVGVDLHRVVEEEVSAILLRSPDALIETEREVNAHIIQGDEDAVRLILGNLLDNAAKYGAPRRVVSLSNSAPGGTGCCSRWPTKDPECRMRTVLGCSADTRVGRHQPQERQEWVWDCTSHGVSRR